jgi:hypothetical protein
LDLGESVETQLVPSQVADDTGSKGSVDSGDSDPESESETANLVLEASPEPELVEQRDPPQVPFPFTWSEGGFLPGGVLPDNEEVLEALLGQVDLEDPEDREPVSTEEIKRALLSRNQYFLGQCFANDCNKLVDHKSVCKQCNIARYCSKECAVFDLGHRSPHPEFHELNTCGVIADDYKWHVVEPSTIVWDEHADDICNNLITFN